MRSHHFLFLFLFFSLTAMGQCPTVNFVIPDSVCAGDTIPVQNLSISGAPVYNWDFNADDLDNTPTGSLVGNFVAQISGCLGIDYGFDNGNYYGFTLNTSGIMARYDFGTSLMNTPVVVPIGNLGILSGTYDFRLIKADGNWYGFTNNPSGVISRIDYGNSLANSPTAVNLNISASLFNTPYYMSVEKVNGNYVAMVANSTGGNITVMDFGTDITNLTPTAFNIPVVSSSPISVAIGTDCDQVYAFVGFTSSSSITQLSFGSTVNANPVITSLTLPGASYRKIELLNDGGGYSLFAHDFSGDKMHQYLFGDNLGNLTPAFRDLGAFNATSNGAYTFTLNKTGSQAAGLIGNYNNGDLTRFIFPESNPETGTTSNDFEPVLTFSGQGFHTIQLTVTDSLTGASEYFTDSIYINNLPAPAFSWQNACEGGLVEFINTTNGTGFTADWTFSSGGSQSGNIVYYQFPSTGTYDVTLNITTTEGCTGDLTQQVTVYELPQVNFSFTDNECAQKDILFQNSSTVSQGTISGYSWAFGDNTTSTDTNPVHPYATNGDYTVSLIAFANGCSDTLEQVITVIEKPEANFSVLNTCVGEIATFQNNSIIANNINLNYNWDLGNSTFSADTNPVVTYPATPANYPVVLVVQAANGCSDTTSMNLRVGNKPNPGFLMSTDTACAGNPVQFTNLSFPASGETLAGFYWDFGDAVIDSLNLNPSHTYQAAGTYTVRLTVISASRCDSSITQIIEVMSSPVAAFTTDTVCSGFATQFTDISTTPSGTTISQWDWNFGDQNTSALSSPQHLYAQFGQYTVNLTITNSFGCYDNFSQTVIVKESPVANFGSVLGCSGLPVQFSDSSTSGPGLTSWYWDFGNSQNSNLQNPVSQFSSSAVYLITLIAGNSAGCYDTISKIKVIEQTPEFTITVTDNCFGQQTIFSYQPAGTPAPNLGFLWDFGDAAFAQQANVMHAYAMAGNYLSSLTVTDLTNTCAGTISDSVHIFPAPIADFISDSGCVNETLEFTDLSTISSGQITTYAWNFGAYGISGLPNPSLTAAAADSFDVQLIVTSDFGCRDTIIHSAEVYANPVTSFTASDYFGAPPLQVNFTNTSDPGSYAWDFGDNGNSTLTNPIHIYQDTGIYTVVLTAVTVRGCTGIYSNTITVQNPLLDLAIENVSFTESAGYWILGSRLKNLGNVKVTNFDLSARLDGRSEIAETFADSSIDPGESLLISFKTRFPSFSDAIPEFLCVKVRYVNNNIDYFTENNERCISKVNDFSLIGIFPNPAIGYLNGSYNLPEAGTISISIYDMQGKILYDEEAITGLKGYNNFYIPCASLASGMYILNLRYNDKEISERVLIN